MSPGPLRRVALVVAFYVLGAWLVIGGARWLAGLLMLPPLFGTLLTGLLIVGLPVAVAAAWRYPAMGQSPERPDRLPPSEGDGAG